MSFDRETKVIYPTDDPSTESSSDPFVTLVVDLGDGSRRAPEQLKRQLVEKEVSTTAELCAKYDVRITGQFCDPDGVTKSVSIPATGEDDFTPDGITKADDSLRSIFVSHAVFEQLARQTGGVGGEPLTESEIERLQDTIALLESAEIGGKNA